jgi:hypothetical protein
MMVAQFPGGPCTVRVVVTRALVTSYRDAVLNSPTMWPMHSLEPEYSEMGAAGLIDKAAESRAIALERGEIFSLFEEVRFALYAAVAAIMTGIGILVKENLEHIGPLTLIVVLALVAAACYGNAIRTRLRHEIRSIAGDYLLLLGALIISADLGYAESHFHWLGSHWSLYLLILAALHALTAYALDSRLVLSVSLTSLAAWFGVEAHVIDLIQSGSSLRNSGYDALACASVIFVWREIHRRLDGAEPFIEIFEHFAANLGFWGTLALCFAADTRIAGIAVLIVLAVTSIYQGLQKSEELFVIYGVAYTAFGLCFVEGQISSGLAAALMELATVTVAVILLWRLRHRPKAVKS